MRNILGHLRRADNDFDLIQDGDKIAIGLSCGKDSLTLVKALSLYKKFKHKSFDIIAITIDCKDGETDCSHIAEFCKAHGIQHHIEISQIFKVIFDIRKEKSPCSLCAKMRRGILHTAAKKHGCNKVALGHHGDDMLETFFLCMLYEGRVSTFYPKTYLDRIDITLIRPLVYATEEEIIKESKGFPILVNTCPVNGYTKREYMKNLVKKLDKEIPDARMQMMKAIFSSNLFDHSDIKCQN